ncbi:hypothetical protein J3R30DRAFT_2151423 [Lentinula aciculospora]|uniref:NAD(P)-binding domain-containing protein n=1 Tax=Lentinula aciculospora TaxID=153920 RepID=A0A9W9AJV6_9AGAR|nr:hypothetical protein J3R30DRAFT_2151423 [Lentinula aciculospora]
MNVFTIGASRNIGYHASLRLLAAGCNITFMLRSPSVFDSDEKIQSYVQSGKAHLIKGDALVQSDVQHAWNKALTFGSVDLVLFSVGGTPSFKLSKGIVVFPPNLVTQSLLNVLCTISTQSPQPRLITISSIGLTRSSHATVPLLLKPLYNMLAVPHKDKVGAERVIAHCAGWKWDSETNGEPQEDIMGERWLEREGLPAAGTFKNVLVIRPALLTDGDCKADKEGKYGYRVKEGEINGAWTVSRKDVAHFVADAAFNRWNEYENKCVSIAN